MKKFCFILLMFVSVTNMPLFAQDSLFVTAWNNNAFETAISKVDTVLFTDSDSIAIVHSTNVFYKEALSKIDSITFNNEKPILAEWDFPVVNGIVNLSQTSGSLSLGSFTGFNAKLTADDETSGVMATGTLWDVNDPGIGIILQYTSEKDFSTVTTVTFIAKVENPPVTAPGIMAYVQNGSKLNWAGDYGFWRIAPITEFQTFTYTIDKTAANLDIQKIYSFRIKANGTGISGTGCGSGGTCAILRVKKVIMQ